MAASGRKTTAELIAYFQHGGEQAIRNYYGDESYFLLVMPDETIGEEYYWAPHTMMSDIPTSGFHKHGTPSTPPSDEVDLSNIDVVPKLPDGSVVVPFYLNKDNHWTVRVGRGEDAQIQIPAASVSRYHAEITNKEGAIQVKDLNSMNGTYVDGIALLPGKPYHVGPYREVRFGPDVVTLFMDIDGLLDVCQLDGNSDK